MSYLFTPKAKPAPDVALGNLDPYLVSSNQQAVPVPYLAGTYLVRLTWISSAFGLKITDVKAQTGKKSRSTVARDYYANIAGALCLGRIDSIKRIFLNSNLVWEGNLERENSGDGAISKALTIEGYGDATIYWGTNAQSPDPLLQSDIPNPDYVQTYNESTGTFSDNGQPQFLTGVSHPAYKGVAYIVFNQLYFGRNNTQAPMIDVEVTRNPNNARLISPPECQDRIQYFIDTDGTGGVNPVGIILDLLTSKMYGLGLSPAMLVSENWAALGSALEAQNELVGGVPTYISIYLNRQTPISDLMSDIASYYDGWFRLVAGKIDAGYFPQSDALDTDALEVVGDSESLGEPQINAEGWGEVNTSFQVNHLDANRHYQQVAVVRQNLAAFVIVQEQRAVTLDKPWITSASFAAAWITRFSNTQGVPGIKVSVNVTRRAAANLKAGDLFVFNYPLLNVSFVLRIMSRNDDKMGGLSVGLECVQEPGLIPAPFAGGVDDAPGVPSTVATPLTIGRAVFIASPTLAGSASPTVALLIIRPTLMTLGFDAYISPDASSYTLLGEQPNYAAFGRLDISIAAGTNLISSPLTCTLNGVDLDLVISQSDADRDANTLLLFMNGEIFSVGEVIALGGNQFTVALNRALYSTAAAGHAKFSQMFFIRRDKLPLFQSPLIPAPGGSVFFRAIPYTPGGYGDASTYLDIQFRYGEFSSAFSSAFA